MKMKVVQAVALPMKDASGKEELVHFGLSLDNKPKVHDFSDEVMAHPHFDQYVAAGYLVEVEQSQAAQLESLQQRNERMAAKLKAAGIEEDPEPEPEAPAADDEGESKKSKRKK